MGPLNPDSLNPGSARDCPGPETPTLVGFPKNAKGRGELRDRQSYSKLGFLGEKILFQKSVSVENQDFPKIVLIRDNPAKVILLGLQLSPHLVTQNLALGPQHFIQLDRTVFVTWIDGRVCPCLMVEMLSAPLRRERAAPNGFQHDSRTKRVSITWDTEFPENHCYEADHMEVQHSRNLDLLCVGVCMCGGGLLQSWSSGSPF